MQHRSSPFDNRLLAALGPNEWLRLQAHAEPVVFTRNQTIFSSGDTVSHAYFPTTLIASMLCVTVDGQCTESALVGNDGMLGVGLFMGGGPTCGCATALTSGEAFRIPAPVLCNEFQRAGYLMHILLRYTQSLLTQAAQRTTCMRHHLVTQQVALCLLQQADRSDDNEVVMTHEQIAMRLGVRREGVTEGAGTLQKLGLIRYARGHVEVLDHAGLEEQACECYGVLRDDYQRLLPTSACRPRLLQAA
ncbi:Crp/Fnr family transcriptional regulator [Hydrogenophaga sp.]|uniref:Crp/Fnr family transcriptional regulator n=1 Tax=Hydrogenophaga sp. TaxID=1904254 RepID=UPI00261BA8DC|nr:Crp/Fnr family transcriptional regulator [Hydrogenophaga sp.]